MGHKVYVSFKAEDMPYKEAVQDLQGIDYVDKSLTVPIDSNDQDYVMRKIREEYLYDSTVTMFLIGAYGAEDRGATEQYYIKKELQASLYNTETHRKSGILGVVLPGSDPVIYRGSNSCLSCGGTHNTVMINDSTVIREFSYNYYIPKNGCSWAEDDRYCVLTKWDTFASDPNVWIDAAYNKRFEAIAAKTKVRP